MSNPFSTGDGGTSFENRVQTVFAINMLINGRVSCGSSNNLFDLILSANNIVLLLCSLSFGDFGGE